MSATSRSQWIPDTSTVYIGRALSLVFVGYPIGIIAANMVSNWKGVTFAVSSPEFRAILVALLFIAAMHAIRLGVLLWGGRNGQVAAEPVATTHVMKTLAAWALVSSAVLFCIYGFTAMNDPARHVWPLVVLLLASMGTSIIAISGYTYGRKVTPHVAQWESYAEPATNSGEDWHEAATNVARVAVPTLKFEDVLGNKEIKARLEKAAREIIAPRKPGQKPRNGILLFGAPGNGKTVFAEALAGQLKLPFLQLTGSDVESKWAGEKTMRIKAAFDQARRHQPCVFFIDEIDTFIPDRSSMTSSVKENMDVVNALLTLLVDIRKTNVIVVAATNYIDRLDGAAVREGRFDFKVEITPPDEEARIGLLRSGMKSNAPKADVSDAVIKNVATRWNGFSVKRILAVTEELPSYLDDMKEKGMARKVVEFDDFMAALRRIQGRKGATPENVKSMDELILPDKTREAIAMIAGRLKDPVRVERLGGTLPTGVLFHGPAGTGKTTVAKALAKEVGSAFLISTGTDLAKDPKELEKLYGKAMELRPAIIFIDEGDDLLRSREYSPNTEATNKLLTLMDGVSDRVRDIVWIAATNHPDQIDPALLRGGRFTEKVEFVRPSGTQLLSHMEKWLADRKIALTEGLTVAGIAATIGEESVANAEAVLQYAVNRAISVATGDAITVSEADISSGLLTVLGRDE